MDTDFLPNWATQLRKGLLELCVLAALRREALYGYDIVKRLAAGGGLLIGEGTVYPILSRFKKDGLVETTLVESAGGPARKYYHLTPKGRLTLAKMLAHWAEVRAGIDAATATAATTEPTP